MSTIILKETTFFSKSEENNGCREVILKGINDVGENKTITWAGISSKVADEIEHAFTSRKQVTFSGHLRFLEYGEALIDLENVN